MTAPTLMEEKLAQVFDRRQAVVLAEVIREAYSDLVRTSDFNELKAIVRDLALAQKELAEAQKRTEMRVEELAEAQKRTEIRVEELAEAQKELTEAQKELAQAQKRTELALQRLSRQVGGLSDRLGGDLEDTAYIVIHDVLEREYGWKVEPLRRDYLRWNGHEVELDLVGRAHDPRHPERVITILGETKFNLTLKEVRRFARKVERVRAALAGECFPVCFCYRARPEVREAVRELGFHLIFSYGHLIPPVPPGD